MTRRTAGTVARMIAIVVENDDSVEPQHTRSRVGLSRARAEGGTREDMDGEHFPTVRDALAQAARAMMSLPLTGACSSQWRCGPSRPHYRNGCAVELPQRAHQGFSLASRGRSFHSPGEHGGRLVGLSPIRSGLQILALPSTDEGSDPLLGVDSSKLLVAARERSTLLHRFRAVKFRCVRLLCRGSQRVQTAAVADTTWSDRWQRC
jgi:hypothetical protein